MSNTAALATVQTTNVKGYFNGNKWPIHVGISELNVTLTLKPGQFVETADWVPAFGIQYKVGVDGLSAALRVVASATGE